MADFHTASGIRSNTRVPRQTVTRIVRRNAPRAEYTEEVDSLESTTRSAAKTTSLEGETADEWGDDVLSQSDAGGNAIFALCICAFVLTALGLSIWLWRKQRQANAIGKVPPGAAGAGEATEVEHNRLAGIFKRKKDRPSPLPLSSIRNPNDPTLPPYSPFAAGPGQSPWTSNNFTFQTAQGAQTGLQNEHEDTNADARSVKSMANLSRAQREAAERAGNPFSPFVPFSPVTTTAPVATQTSAREQLNDADDEDKQAVRSFSRRNDPTFNASSSLHHSVTMPTPAPVRYMDPEVAQAMGIHPEVIKTAEPGVSEEEIERRRVRAQRRLEERQRADEGSIVEDTLEASHFSQIASNRRA